MNGLLPDSVRWVPCCCSLLAPRTTDGDLVPLTENEIAALTDLIADEYRSRDVYRSVLAIFGPVRPFDRIAMAEEQHIAALASQFELYSLEVPEAPETDLPVFDSYRAALEWAIASEEANAKLYETYMNQTEKENLTTMFAHLRDASRERHKAAFERQLTRWGR